jgi:preprotein translocase subunit SecE
MSRPWVRVVKIFNKLLNFIKEVKQELTKVAWSTRQELIGSTILVISTTFIMAIFIGIVDLVLSKFLSMVFR